MIFFIFLQKSFVFNV